MHRMLLLVAAFAIAAAPGIAAAAVITAPTTPTTASVNTTSTQTTTTTPTAPSVTTASVATTGNGAPSGSHYNLNIIGVPKNKTADMTGNDGHRIFVSLTGGEDATLLNKQVFTEISRLNKNFLMPAPPSGSFPLLDAHVTARTG